MFEEATQSLSELRHRLDERVSPRQALPGTMVSWRTPAGFENGVIVGHDGEDLLVGVAYERSLKNDRRVKMYRDESLSAKVSGIGVPGIVMDIHRVPAKRAYMQGRVTGAAMQPYVKMGLGLTKEGVESLFEASLGKLGEIRERLDEGKGKMPKVGGTLMWKGKELKIFKVKDDVKSDDVVIVTAGRRAEKDASTYYFHKSTGKWMDAAQHRKMKTGEGHAYARRTPNLPQDMQVYTGDEVDEAAKLGSGARFKALSKKIAKRGGVRDPDAVAAAIGRRKYGKKKFQSLAKKGRKESIGEADEWDAQREGEQYLDKHVEKVGKKGGRWIPPHNLLLNQALMGMNLWRFGYDIGYRKDHNGLTIRPMWHSLQHGRIGSMNMSGFSTIDVEVAKKLIALLKKQPSIQDTVKEEIAAAERKFGIEIPKAIKDKLLKDAVKVAKRRWGVDRLKVKKQLLPFDGSKPRYLGAWD